MHDLAYYFPKFRAYKFSDTKYMKFMIKRSCFAADKIIAVSENTKNDLLSLFNIPPSKIETVYEAADDGYKKIDDKQKLENIRRKYELDRKFIFYPGNISPRKNIERLINAFEKVQDKIDLDLVLTGHNMWNSHKEIGMIKKNRRIKLLGCIPDEDLPSIYNIAEAFVYVSLYEGFGIPIVEAQRCGCPVIVSDSASLPEVAGKGAIVVDPYDEGEITRAILQVVEDRSTREKVIQEGYKNAERFSWKKSAKETIELIRGVC
ncbi:MAG: glycosyltransferase family 1 protein [Candidatus Omnitrophota bacterium]